MSKVLFQVRKQKFKVSTLCFLIAFLALYMIIPTIFSGYMLNMVNLILIWTMAAFGLSILFGMCGQMSFAMPVFMAAGAYWVANMSTGRLGYIVDTATLTLTAPLVAGALGFVSALVLFRLRGTFFVFGTMSLATVVGIFLQNYVPLFGGPDGINRIPYLSIGSFVFDTKEKWFYLLAVVTLILGLLTERFRKTAPGRAMYAVRDDETAAKVMGVNVYMTKIFAFTVASMFAGFAGALYAMCNRYVAYTLFTTTVSTNFMMMVMIGGSASTIGVLIGAIIVTGLPEMLRDLATYLRMAYGVLVIVLMNVMPTGFMGFVKLMSNKVYQLFSKQTERGNS